MRSGAVLARAGYWSSDLGPVARTDDPLRASATITDGGGPDRLLLALAGRWSARDFGSIPASAQWIPPSGRSIPASAQWIPPSARFDPRLRGLIPGLRGTSSDLGRSTPRLGADDSRLRGESPGLG